MILAEDMIVVEHKLVFDHHFRKTPCALNHALIGGLRTHLASVRG